jgi:hypothetical protein
LVATLIFYFQGAFCFPLDYIVIIAHFVLIVKGFSKLFLFFILEAYSSVGTAGSGVKPALSFPLDCIYIIAHSQKNAIGKLTKCASKILTVFVQNAEAPGRR